MTDTTSSNGKVSFEQALALSRTMPTARVLPAAWGYGQDRSHPMVLAALKVLSREGFTLQDLSPARPTLAAQWGRTVAERLAAEHLRGAVLFCEEPELVACIANKTAGLRAASVSTVAQAARATMSLSANLLVVEMPGRTFFEIRQMLQLMFQNALPCPEVVAHTLQEMESHADR